MSLILSIFLLITIYVVLLVNGARRTEYEGDFCRNSDGSRGICRLLLDCKVALDSVIQHQSHKYHRCGFSDKTEIVCCPNTLGKSIPEQVKTTREKPRLVVSGSSTERTFTRNKRRKSEEVCGSFSQLFSVGVDLHISNGEDTNLGEFPHMAAIGYLDDEGHYEWNCGASLISERWLVTASHCRYPPNGLEPSRIKLGLVELNHTSSFSQELDIKQFVLNPKYNYTTRKNDIALIELEEEVVFGQNVWPACLYTQDDDPPGLIVTGWGQTSNVGPMSNKLLKAHLNPVSVLECHQTIMELLQKNVTETQICASNNRTNADACGGDSGGPLQAQVVKESDIFSIVGITSYGSGCGGATPGVYTRVSKYLDWIEEMVWS